MLHDADGQLGFVSWQCQKNLTGCGGGTCVCRCHETPERRPLSVPAGHSVAAHLLIGWCAACPGRNVQHEVEAWRWWAVTNVPEVGDLVGPARQPINS